MDSDSSNLSNGVSQQGAVSGLARGNVAEFADPHAASANSLENAEYAVRNTPALQSEDIDGEHKSSILDMSLGIPDTEPPPKTKQAISRQRLISVCLLVFGVAAAVLLGLRIEQAKSNVSNVGQPSDRLTQQGAALSGLSQQLGTETPATTTAVTVNGQLDVTKSLVLQPSTVSGTGITGQLYYDQTTNQLSYYNGNQFVNLLGGGQTVTSLGGLQGALSIGSGLSVNGGSVSNTGVLSVQGQSGHVVLTGGQGIAINGTSIGNSGVLSLGGKNGAIQLGNGLALAGNTLNAQTGIQNLTAGTNNVSVTNSGNGSWSIGVNGVGSGTVSSPGGTIGTLPYFDGSQDIADSLVSQSGSTVTVGGNLNVTGGLVLGTALGVLNGGTGSGTASGARTNLGAAASGSNSDITSLSGLTTALSVLQGGTGASTFTANGVLIGNGTNPVSAVTTATPGQCLVSSAGAPVFQACPGAGGVATLDTLTGALTIANSTGSGAIITINDAKSDGTTKGLATFNSSDFRDNGSGVIDTIQGIGTTATPQFAGLTLTNPLTVANGGLGLASLTSHQILVASGTTSIGQLSNGLSGNCLVSNGSGASPTFQSCFGTGTGGIGGTGTAGTIALFSGTNSVTNSDITDSGGVVTINGTATAFNLQNSSGNNVLSASIASGTVTLGNVTTTAGHGLTGQLLLADGTSDGFSGTIKLAGAPTASITYLLPTTSTGTETICTTDSASCSSTYLTTTTGANTSLSNLTFTNINNPLNFGGSSGSVGFGGSIAGANGANMTVSGQSTLTTGFNGGSVTIQGGSTGTGTGGTANVLGGSVASGGINGGVVIDTGHGATAANGTLSIGNTYAANINVGNATGTINLGTTATTGITNIGGASTTGAINVGQYTGTGSATINVGNTNLTTGTQNINIGSGTVNGGGGENISIGSGSITNGSDIINIGHGATGSNVSSFINIGSSGALNGTTFIYGPASTLQVGGYDGDDNPIGIQMTTNGPIGISDGGGVVIGSLTNSTIVLEKKRHFLYNVRFA